MEEQEKDPLLVAKEIATKEINEWLDYKKVSADKRKTQEAQINVLIDAITEGFLIVNSDKTLTHKLKFPVEGSGNLGLSELVYKPRLAFKEVHFHLKQVASNDPDGRVLSYILALTKKSKALVEGIDSEDHNIAQAVAVFFI